MRSRTGEQLGVSPFSTTNLKADYAPPAYTLCAHHQCATDTQSNHVGSNHAHMPLNHKYRTEVAHLKRVREEAEGNIARRNLLSHSPLQTSIIYPLDLATALISDGGQAIDVKMDVIRKFAPMKMISRVVVNQ